MDFPILFILLYIYLSFYLYFIPPADVMRDRSDHLIIIL